eukprot:5462865-Prymnesium_polylepis.2
MARTRGRDVSGACRQEAERCTARGGHRGSVCTTDRAHEPLHDLGRRDQRAMGDSMQWTRARRQRQPTA